MEQNNQKYITICDDEECLQYEYAREKIKKRHRKEQKEDLEH
jgi:hypothetical protein